MLSNVSALIFFQLWGAPLGQSSLKLLGPSSIAESSSSL